MSNAVTVAGIDCGTNSIRLMVARADDDGIHVVVPRIMRVVRLGQGIDETHRFADEALERTYAACREFADVLKQHPVDALRFVATSATRDAQNREAFEDTVEQILGVRPDVIPGTEEARLSFLGATSVVDQQAGGIAKPPYVVIDLGGGSTEVVLGGDGDAKDNVQAAFSMNIGSVRMTERHLHSDPPTEEEIAEATRDIDEHITEAFRIVPAGQARTIIGVSGTVTTMTGLAQGLAAYDRDAVDGAVISIDDACATDDRILRMARAQRADYPVIHPGRIDVIGGGALVWTRVLRRIQEAAREQGHAIDSYIASEHGLLDGIVRDLAQRVRDGR
ncbi:MAG: Ppx/GppA phosphatase family protein [Bifidobacteriaceae bacterium]|nr:Ppx/GppA phosphatase family protein [Bifidobacteriaceae bacterium]